MLSQAVWGPDRPDHKNIQQYVVSFFKKTHGHQKQGFCTIFLGQQQAIYCWRGYEVLTEALDG
jgi:hypothetical protein